MDAVLVVTIQRQADPWLGSTAELTVLVMVGPVGVAVEDFLTSVLFWTFVLPVIVILT